MLARELVSSPPPQKPANQCEQSYAHSIAARDTDKRVVQLDSGEAEDFWWVAASANRRSDVLQQVYGERFMRAVPIAGGRYEMHEGGRAHIVVRPAASLFLCRSVVTSLSGLDLAGKERREAIEAATNDHLDKLLLEEKLRCAGIILEERFLASSYR